MAKKELALTQQDLNEEGIKTQLTQNDLLEVLVNERCNTIQAEIKFFKERAQSFRTQAQDEVEFWKLKAKKAALEVLKANGIKISDDFECNVHFADSYYPKTTYTSIKFPGTYNVARKEFISSHSISVDLGPKNFTANFSVIFMSNSKVEVNSSLTSKVSLTHTVNVKIKIKDGHVGVKSLIEEHNEEVKAYIDSMKDVAINSEAVLKEVRIEFNKKLISTGSPKLKSKIFETFGLTF